MAATTSFTAGTPLFVLLILVSSVSGSVAPPAESASRLPQDPRPLQCRVEGTWIGNAIAYGPFRDGQRPGGDTPSRAELAEDLTLMRPHWQLLRTYSAGETTAALLDVIQERDLDMKVMVGAWIAPQRDTQRYDGTPQTAAESTAANRRQVASAIELANTYPDIVIAISVGNETQVSWSSHRVDPDVLRGYIRQVRDATRVPVTTADDYTFWVEPRSRTIAAEVDFICAHIYAMWRGEQLADAVAFTQREYDAVCGSHPAHTVVIGELGWATQKHDAGDQAKHIRGTPGEVEQKQFYDALLAWTTRTRVVNFYFEAFDENWKGGPHPDEVEKHWGLYHSDRTPKLALRSRAGIVDDEWRQRVCQLAWICYTPAGSNPDRGVYPEADNVRADLVALRAAGFTGLITYGCKSPTLRTLPRLAEELGFKGLIIGVWNPLDEEELAAARTLAEHDLVVGLCLGNEGLGSRYTYEALIRALDRMRQATGKPVTTTEEIGDYIELRVLHAGDWVFPNAHPVYHGRATVDAAVRWTAGACDDLRRRADRFVWFKEVGWPSGGGEAFTPQAQASYYEQLAEQCVTFAYFEAFDQPWKQWHECEPHFGLFDAQRNSKQLVDAWASDGPATLCCPAKPTAVAPAAAPSRDPLYVYREHDSAENRFTPTGRQGDAGDVHVDTDWRENVHDGETCVRLRLEATGAGPHTCEYAPPCRWAGLRWLHPAHNWGRSDDSAGRGLDLRGYRRLVFWTRAEEPCTVTFLVGGVDTQHGDSLTFPARTICRLDEQWHRYSIDLTGCDLRHIIAGFGCVTTWESNPDGVTVFLDEIRFE